MLPTEEEERKGRRGRREARTRCVLQGIIEHDDGFICSRRNRRHLQRWSPTELGKETQILMLHSGTRVVLLGWFSFLFGNSNTLCKCLILPTNPPGPSVSNGWRYCFYSSLFETHVARLLLSWEACPGIPAEA